MAALFKMAAVSNMTIEKQLLEKQTSHCPSKKDYYCCRKKIQFQEKENCLSSLNFLSVFFCLRETQKLFKQKSDINFFFITHPSSTIWPSAPRWMPVTLVAASDNDLVNLRVPFAKPPFVWALCDIILTYTQAKRKEEKGYLCTEKKRKMRKKLG